MGNRLHVAKKFVLEYADVQDFNYGQEAFDELLDFFGIDNSESPHYEITKWEWDNMIAAIRGIHDKTVGFPFNVNDCADITEDDVPHLYRISTDLGCNGFDKLASHLERLEKESDPNNDFLVLDFF